MPLSLIITDSRGVPLGDMLRDISTMDYHVASFPGATLSRLVCKAPDLIYRLKPNTVIFLGGINDLTMLDRSTKTVTLRFSTPEIYIKHISDTILAAGILFYREFPDINFVFGGLIGIDISTYNKCPCDPAAQELVNRSIIGVNRKIKELNEAAGVPHVYFSAKVHRWEKGICIHRYHLLFDGLHLRFGVLKFWVQQIVKIHTRINTQAQN